MSNVNINSKSILAKLMAAEDVHVTHNPKATTAEFNVKTRQLTLPILKDMNGVVYDGFVSHEIGHALYTPMDELLEAITSKVASKSLLNIVEDARIEKLVKRKFPGCVKMFKNFYAQLFANEFFGTTPVDEMKFIDRINIHFKVGGLAAVQFNEGEQALVDLVGKAETYADVVHAAKLIKAFVKENKEPTPEQPEQPQPEQSEQPEQGEQDQKEVEYEQDDDAEEMEQPSNDQEDADTDGDADEESDGEESEGSEADEDADETEGDTDITGDADEAVEGDDDDEAEDGDATDDDDDSEENDEAPDEDDTGKEGGAGGDDEIDKDSAEDYDSDEDSDGELTDEQLEEEMESDTQNEFDEKFENEAVEEGNANNSFEEIHIDDIKNPMEHTMSYKDIIAECKEYYDGDKDEEQYIAEAYKKFSNEIKPQVKHLMKVFDQKKSADEYQRTTTAKSGVLDTNKMHAYKIADDIFARGTVIQEGKNHGFVIVVDFSGSMQYIMRDTMRQLLTLATFCRQANIPLEVYSFTTGRGKDNKTNKDFAEYTFTINEDLDMHNFISTSMNKKEFAYVAGMMLNFSRKIGSSYYNRNYPKVAFNMYGTPLDQAILLTTSLVRDFKKNHGVEICNTIFMTDGAGHPGQTYKSKYTEGGAVYPITHRANLGGNFRGNSYFNIVDDVTKESNVYMQNTQTEKVEFEGLLFKALTDRTGSTVMTIRLLSPKDDKYSRMTTFVGFGFAREDYSKVSKEFMKEGFLMTEAKPGVDQSYIVNTNIMGKVQTKLGGHVDAKSAKREFNKMAKNSKANRFMFNKMMELVA